MLERGSKKPFQRRRRGSRGRRRRSRRREREEGRQEGGRGEGEEGVERGWKRGWERGRRGGGREEGGGGPEAPWEAQQHQAPSVLLKMCSSTSETNLLETKKPVTLLPGTEVRCLHGKVPTATYLLVL